MPVRHTPASGEAGLSAAGPVWQKYGLSSAGHAGPEGTEVSRWPRSRRFRAALEELGGLYAFFGRFLAGRIDLLPPSHSTDLLGLPPPPCSGRHAARLREFAGDRLEGMSPLCARFFSETYSGRWHGTPVVLEVFDAAPRLEGEERWTRFRAGVQLLAGGEEGAAVAAPVLESFAEWLSLQGDIARKRSIISNLHDAPASCLFLPPRLVPEVQADDILVCRGVDGCSLEQILEQEGGRRHRLQLVIEGMLEHALLLSCAPAELDPSNILLTRDGLVAFRSFPAAAIVPAEASFELLQYIASTAAGDTPRAIRMTARMVRGDSEQRLWREFSGLQPVLKVRQDTPPSVTALENYWRTLSATGLRQPLFLQLFHRNLELLGHYNGLVAPDSDLVSRSLLPVLGRILRFRVGEIASPERVREWAVGAGLLFFATARQMGLTLEQIRDNDLSLTVEAGQEAPREAEETRPMRAMAAGACFLVLFVASVQAALHLSGPAAGWAAAGGVVCAAGLFLSVARISG